MRKLQVVVLTLVAMGTIAVLFAGAASAETTLVALWLVNGATITANLASEIVIEVLSEDTKVPLVGDAAFICSGILVGTSGAEGKGSITSVLNLAKELIGTPLSGLTLSCANELNCGTPIEVWPVGLPWGTQLFLMAGTTGEPILELITGSGYEIVCTELGVKVTDECKATDTEVLVQNNSVTGNAEIPSKSRMEPLALCTQSGEETGINETEGIAPIELANKGEEGLLSVSSE